MAGPHPALFDIAAGRPLRAVHDLERLSASAVEHHMAGLLWSCVLRGEIDGPTAWKSDLARLDLQVEGRHRVLWQRIADVTGRLEAIGVQVAVLKGVPAEHRWYDRMGERPSVDVDLLVAPDSLGRADEIVAELQPAHPLRGSVQESFERGICQSIDLRVDGVSVDLHLDLFKLGLPSHDPDRLWKRTVSIACDGGQVVRVLDAELSLVHLMVHMNRDSYRWLLGFSDVRRILERETIDWDEVRVLAVQEGIEVPVWAGLTAVAPVIDVAGPAVTPGGWRMRLWGVLWRPSVRLQGNLGFMRYRHRFRWLPLVTDARPRDVLRWQWAQLVLSAPVANDVNAGRQGPWWWRLVRGRLSREVKRRRTIAQLRKAEERQAG